VQRGLEKATQEATRIAKAQRLRANLDGLTKQIEAQQGAITTKAMELFRNGQLTQSELLVLCQELNNAQQQFMKIQHELKQMQQNQNNSGATTVAYTQPTFQPYDVSQPSLIPPPPPGVEPLSGGSNETVRAEMATPSERSELKHCTSCLAVLIPGNAFCHNCGTPVRAEGEYVPTARSSSDDAIHSIYSESTVFDGDGQPTIHANDDEHSSQEKDGGL
jgi:hypothetical protein